jgi:uncharacterized protein YhjY with autotransporter beta-barrel domain
MRSTFSVAAARTRPLIRLAALLLALIPGLAGAALLGIVLDEDDTGGLLHTRTVPESFGAVPVGVRLEREPNDVGICAATGILETYAPGTGQGIATPGDDYVPLSESFSIVLDIEEDAVEAVFDLTIVDDAIAEPDEQVNLRLVELTFDCDSPPGLMNGGEGIVTISDDDESTAALSIVQSAITVPDGASSAMVELVLDPGNVQLPISVPVDVATRDGTALAGTDYEATSTTLTFTEDALTQSVVVPLLANPDATSARQFFVDLANEGGVFAPAAGTFAVQTNDETATITIDAPGTRVEIDSVSFCVDASGFAADARIRGAENVEVSFFLGADSNPLTAPTQRFSVAFAFGETTLLTSPPVIETLGSPALDRWQDGAVSDSTLVPLGPGSWSIRGRSGHGADPFQPGDVVWGLVVQVEGQPDQVSGGIPVQICADDGSVPPAVEDVVNLSGTPGTSVSHQFPVTGSFPMSLSAQAGSVTPATLDAAGNATYTREIPASAAVDSVLRDTITLTDAEGISRLIAVNVEVVATAERDITSIPFLTPNQRALAQWVDDVCPRLQDRGAETALEQDLLDICARLRNPDNLDTEVANALDAINPEEWMAATGVALRLTRVQHGNLGQRINAVRAGATGLDLSGLNVRIHGLPVPQEALMAVARELFGGGASADEPIGGADFGRWGFFANGNVSFGDQRETANQAGFDFNTLGITAGVDYRLRDNAFVGAAVGYANVDVDFARSGGDLDVDSWNLSLFGSWFKADRYYVDGLVNYGRNDYASTRHIRFTDALGTVDRTARGDTDGRQLSGSLAAGYDFTRGPWTFGPHVGTDYLDVDVDSVQEQGAGALDMTIGKQSAKSFTVNAGGHLSYVYTASWGVLIPHARLDFVREFERDRYLMNVRLAADPFANDPLAPSPMITLQSDRADPSYLVWSAGASAQFIHGIAGFVNYQRISGMDAMTFSQVNFGLRFERSF